MENSLGMKARNERFERWSTCSLCKQLYHGVVAGALGWASWKTYVGRPEVDQTRRLAMGQLGNGLFDANHHEDALSVKKAELSLCRRLGASENNILIVQSNLASTYRALGRLEYALRMRREVYSEYVKIHGEEHGETLIQTNNLANLLIDLKRYEEAKSLMLEMIPVAQRVLGESKELTLRMRTNYAMSLYQIDGATLDDLRESVTTLEETERIARRVLGGAHPVTVDIEDRLRDSRVALRARETPLGTAQ